MLNKVLVDCLHDSLIEFCFNFLTQLSLGLFKLILCSIAHYIFDNLIFQLISVFEIGEFASHTLNSIIIQVNFKSFNVRSNLWIQWFLCFLFLLFLLASIWSFSCLQELKIFLLQNYPLIVIEF